MSPRDERACAPKPSRLRAPIPSSAHMRRRVPGCARLSSKRCQQPSASREPVPFLGGPRSQPGRADDQIISEERLRLRGGQSRPLGVGSNAPPDPALAVPESFQQDARRRPPEKNVCLHEVMAEVEKGELVAGGVLPVDEHPSLLGLEQIPGGAIAVS